MRSCKRILLHDRTGVPFTVQLGRELAGRGHNVLYSYAAFFQSPKGDLLARKSDPATFRIEAMEMEQPFEKYSFIKRRFQEIEYAKDLVEQITSFEPDILIIAGSPPDAMAVVYRECREMNIKLVFWVQDLYSIAIQRILNKKLPILGNLIGKYYVWQERRLLQQSDEVVLITEDFTDLMNRWGIDSQKQHVIHNWTPIEELPVGLKDNEWARQHGVDDKFCILYAGTLGLKHNPDLLLQLALHFRNNPDVRIVVISEGLGADWLREQKAAHALSNLMLLDFQPFKQMPDVLAAADVLVAILEPDAGVYSAPSKVLTYLCARRPLLLAVPPQNLSARIVAENRAGVVIEPSETQRFVEAADRLFLETALREELGCNARLYAERNFNIEAIGDRFEEIIY